MKVNISKISLKEIPINGYEGGIRFEFILMEGDTLRAHSTNAGKSAIKLNHNICHFYFKDELELPHPDLLAFSALKIISPYVGKEIYFQYPISKKFSEFVLKKYKNIKKVNIDYDLEPFLPTGSRSVVSFSGGVDSIASAMLCDDGTELIMCSATQHKELIGKYKQLEIHAKKQIKTLNKMPDRFKKSVVYTDFMFLSGNDNAKVYPDTYLFTLPSVLLSESQGIKNIIVGDCREEFEQKGTVFPKNFSWPAVEYFASIDLNVVQPTKGVSEMVTTKIAGENGMLAFSVSCERSFVDSADSDCDNCPKCFRKKFYEWALFGNEPNNKLVNNFNKNLSSFDWNDGSRKNYDFQTNWKFIFKEIDYEFEKQTSDFIKFINSVVFNNSFLLKVYPDPYSPNTNEYKYLARLTKYCEIMTPEDIKNYKLLNWGKISCVK